MPTVSAFPDRRRYGQWLSVPETHAGAGVSSGSVDYPTRVPEGMHSAAAG